MGKTSKIQWTDATWNIAVGCTKVDGDCKYCYMYRDSNKGTRFNPKVVKQTKTVFRLPLTLKEPSRIFTCSYTDFFHEACDRFRDEAWEIIRQCPQHTFQILTKRPERIPLCLPPDWGVGYDNVWLGTSIGHDAATGRAYTLATMPAKIKFLSLEPLWEPVTLSTLILQRFHWVIVGGESGNDSGQYRYRRCSLRWIEDIVSQCKTVGVPVFVKQLGTHLAKELVLSDRHGGVIEDWPKHLQIREFPKPIN